MCRWLSINFFASLSGCDAEAETSNEEPNMKRQKTLHKFVKNKSIEEDVATLASVDGLSFTELPIL